MLGDRLVGYTLREIAAERKFSQELRIEVLEQVLPVATIQAVLAREGRMGQRERKLNMVDRPAAHCAAYLQQPVAARSDAQSEQRVALCLAGPGVCDGRGQCVELSAVSTGGAPVGSVVA